MENNDNKVHVELSPSARNVVSNIRSKFGKEAEPFADWQIDAAHRLYSTSEEFGNEQTILDWVPKDTDEQRGRYMRMTERERR